MPCSRCKQEKPTPVSFKGKQLCLACASIEIEEAHDRELRINKTRVELKTTEAEFQDLINRCKDAATLRESYLNQFKELEKQVMIAEAKLRELVDQKNSAFNRLDKLKAALQQAECQ
jgi:chromosome segregation ATPase